MRVELGPVPAQSARTWVGWARQVLADVRAGRTGLERLVEPEVVDAFEAYLDEWEEAARGEEFRWSTEADPEVVEYHVHAFFRLAKRIADLADEPEARQPPPGGEAFYASLVTGVLDALGAEGPARSEFSDHLRNFWPGLEDRREAVGPRPPRRHPGRDG